MTTQPSVPAAARAGRLRRAAWLLAGTAALAGCATRLEPAAAYVSDPY
ncbi:MAG: hypothetical protein KY444_09135 [Gemmatimonadetes bacterium]|nr:hypothetical protein [Gemmatimonadota bacterium]